MVCVLLGLDMPLLLRALPGNPERFIVVGPAFVYGLHDAIALLGPLPSPWVTQVFDDSRGETRIFRFLNTDTNSLSYEDPRLGPLDEMWKRVNMEPRTADDPATFQRFQNRDTGEVITHDPRLNPDALIAREVDIRTFTLV